MAHNLQERAHLVPLNVAGILNESGNRPLHHDELFEMFTEAWRHPALRISDGFPQANAAGLYFYNIGVYDHDGMQWDDVGQARRRHCVTRRLPTTNVHRVGCSEATFGLFHRRTHHIRQLDHHLNDEPTIVHYYWVDNNGNVVNNGGGGDGGGEGDGGDEGDGHGQGGDGVGTEWSQLCELIIILAAFIISNNIKLTENDVVDHTESGL